MEKFCFECRENSGISLVLISQGNFRWPFNQSDARIKPNWSLAFSYTLRSLRGELWILIGFLWYSPTIWFVVIIYLTLVLVLRNLIVKCCTTVIGCIWKPLFCNTAYEISLILTLMDQHIIELLQKNTLQCQSNFHVLCHKACGATKCTQFKSSSIHWYLRILKLNLRKNIIL